MVGLCSEMLQSWSSFRTDALMCAALVFIHGAVGGASVHVSYRCKLHGCKFVVYRKMNTNSMVILPIYTDTFSIILQIFRVYVQILSVLVVATTAARSEEPSCTSNTVRP